MSAAGEQKFGRYTLKTLLGRGGMAEVYLAHDPQLDRDVAIKLILPQFTDEPGFSERFAYEARAVARLRHPNIVQVHDFDIAAGRPYMVMELADGPSLKQRLQTQREQNLPLPSTDVLSITSAIGSALDYAHRQGMLHRDVKPSNILFTQGGDPLLADFGLAQITGQSLHTALGTISGTPAYMAPEQAQGKPEAASDLYSLAVVAYEMLAGRPPFVGATPTELLLQHLQTPPPPPLSFRADLPAGLGDVFQKALAKSPAARYASAADFVAALRLALQPATAATPVSQDTPTVHGESLPLMAEPPPPAQPAAATPPPPAAAALVAQAPAPAAEPQAPKPKTALDEHLPRVVNTLGAVAQVLAPLIGREKLAVKPNADDRRSAVASLMAILGIFLAALQFFSSALDLAYRVFGQLSQVLPVIIVALLAFGALAALQVMRRSASRPNRRYAAAVLAVIVIGGAAWGGWQFYERTRPPAGPIVIIADFQPCKGCPEVDHGQRIYLAVKAQTDRLRLPNLEVRHVLETYTDSAAARARGEDYKATLVIWGSYDTAGLLPHFELLRGPEIFTRDPTSASGSQAAHLVRPDELSTIDFHLGTGDSETAFATVLALGLIRYAERDYLTALRVYDAALATMGGDPTRGVPNAEVVYYYKALALYANGESWSSIVDNLRKALALKPNWAEPHYVLALASLNSCTPDGKNTLDMALSESEAAVQLRADANSYWLRGQVLAQLRRWADAAKSYEQSLKLQDDLEVRNELATAYRNLGRAADAAALLAKAAPPAAASSDEVLRLRAQGTALSAQGNYTAAITTYQQAISRAVELRQPDTALAVAYMDLGSAQSGQAQFAAAVMSYEKAESLWGKHWLGYYSLAYAYQQVGRIDNAIAAYQKVLDDTPCDATAHSVIAGLYQQQGKATAALDEYQKAASADPSNGTVMVAMALLLSAQGKTAEAEAALHKSVGLLDAQLQQEPVNANIAYLLGLSNLQLQDYAAALLAFQKYVALAPADASGHHYLAQALEARGRDAEALAEYRAAVARQPGSAAFQTDLAWILVNMGQTDEAIPIAQRALQLDPGQVLAHYVLALAYQAKADKPHAIAEFQEVVKSPAASAGLKNLANQALHDLGQ